MPVKTAQRTVNKEYNYRVDNSIQDNLNPDFESNFDSQGSYTGVNSDDKYEKPIQDADDL